METELRVPNETVIEKAGGSSRVIAIPPQYLGGEAISCAWDSRLRRASPKAGLSNLKAQRLPRSLRSLAMTKRNSAPRNQKGFALITSYILISSLLTLVTAFFFRSFNNMRMTDMRLERVQTAFLSEAAADKALVEIKDQFKDVTSIPNLQPLCSGTASGAQELVLFDESFDQGTIRARLTTDCNRPNQVFWVLARSSYNGSNREIRIAVKLEPFYKDSKFVIDRMHPDVYFTAANEFGVPVHVNGPLQVYGSLTFIPSLEPVFTSSASYIKMYTDGYTENTSPSDFHYPGLGGMYSVYGNAPFYPESVKLNEPRISFPRPDLSYLKKKSDIKVIDKKAWTFFNPDNTVSLSYDGPITTANPPDETIDLSKWAGIYFTGQDPSDKKKPGVYIRGQIAKTLLIASKNDIGINGSIDYDSYSIMWEGIPPFGSKLLGVVSEKNIVVDQISGMDISGDTEVHLSGAYAALGGSFLISSNAAEMRQEGADFTVFVLGSVSQALAQGLFHMDSPVTDGMWKPDAFTVFYLPDSRLNYQTIPYFPIATSILTWEDCGGICSEHKNPTPEV